MKYTFPAVLMKDEYNENVINVSFPDLLGVNTFGLNREEALVMAKDVLESVLTEIEELRKITPTPIEKLQAVFEDVVLVEVTL